MQIDYKNAREFIKEFKEQSKNYNYENLKSIIDWMDNYARLMDNYARLMDYEQQ